MATYISGLSTSPSSTSVKPDLSSTPVTTASSSNNLTNAQAAVSALNQLVIPQTIEVAGAALSLLGPADQASELASIKDPDVVKALSAYLNNMAATAGTAAASINATIAPTTGASAAAANATVAPTVGSSAADVNATIAPTASAAAAAANAPVAPTAGATVGAVNPTIAPTTGSSAADVNAPVAPTAGASAADVNATMTPIPPFASNPATTQPAVIATNPPLTPETFDATAAAIAAGNIGKS